MIAIDNANLLAKLPKPPVNTTGFSPVITAAITWGTSITLTDASTFPSGDSFKKINITINDEDGGTAYGAITSASGNTGAISVAGLKQTGTYTIKATVASALGCLGDGSVIISIANTTATVGNYAITFTTAI